LIGTDIFQKYKIGLHPTNNSKLYNLTVGVEPICRIPCQVVRKLTDKIVCNKIKVTENDDSLEDEIEPGYEFERIKNCSGNFRVYQNLLMYYRRWANPEP
jgi:hypothetical protein